MPCMHGLAHAATRRRKVCLLLLLLPLGLYQDGSASQVALSVGDWWVGSGMDGRCGAVWVLARKNCVKVLWGGGRPVSANKFMRGGCLSGYSTCMCDWWCDVCNTPGDLA
jgi:hypothetical protein